MTDRRLFIKKTVVSVGVLCTPLISKAAVPVAGESDRRLNLFNTHTGETFNNVFWTGGKFMPDALARINNVLRDHRTNTVAPIDTTLLNLVAKLSTQIRARGAVHVISGYRSPESNQWLADHTDGVAKNSLHMQGRAIDIRVPGRELKSVRDAAMRMHGGGVGFYPASQFVHLDTGRLRHW